MLFRSDYFGESVAISGDHVVVGAHYDDGAANGNGGSAYVFQRQADGTWSETQKLTASDAATGDRFGRTVSVSGDTAVVGTFGDDDAGGSSGSAYIFERYQGGVDNWGQVAKLTASDAAVLDFFARSVSVSGDTAVV